MEILIIGGIVVLLMVIVSTQIKKGAAQAFDKEIIESADFSLIKPEGFMSPLRESSNFLFEAYSKDFGDGDERNVWKAQAYLSVSDDSNFAAACESARLQAGEITSEKTFENAANEKSCLIESEKIEEDAAFYEVRKIVESRSQHKIYELRIAVLKAFRDEYSDKISELLNSFHLK